MCFFFFKQKTAYEMRISDWSSDVCSSDLDDNGEDHMLKDMRTRELMSTYLMTVPTYGTFVISEGVLTKVVGLATEGRVVQDYASWETARQFWRKFRRSEERRVGKECVSQCRSRGSQDP